MSTISHLAERGVAKPPRWLPTNTHYETIMGSVAYGVSSDTSDMDIYGFAIPPKDYIFPHLRGEILGFGQPGPRFDQYQEHHIADPGGTGRTYDITLFGIVKYFQLAMDNNPNIIDSLFTPANCVLHSTRVGNMVRENRRKFLHKGCWPKFKGYAYSQLHKIAVKKPPEGKRLALVEEHGYDTKFAYHVVRLMLEAEQILTLGDIDLQRDNEQMKAVRRGEWAEDRLRRWAADKEAHLETAFASSKLPAKPDELGLRGLLVDCLEEHFGSLSAAIVDQDAATVALRGIRDQVDKVRHLLG